MFGLYNSGATQVPAFILLSALSQSVCLHAQSSFSFLTLTSFSSSAPSLIAVLSKVYIAFLLFFYLLWFLSSFLLCTMYVLAGDCSEEREDGLFAYST